MMSANWSLFIAFSLFSARNAMIQWAVSRCMSNMNEVFDKVEMHRKYLDGFWFCFFCLFLPPCFTRLVKNYQKTKERRYESLMTWRGSGGKKAFLLFFFLYVVIIIISPKVFFSISVVCILVLNNELGGLDKHEADDRNF